jgi:hypothetical protein
MPYAVLLETFDLTTVAATVPGLDQLDMDTLTDLVGVCPVDLKSVLITMAGLEAWACRNATSPLVAELRKDIAFWGLDLSEVPS